MTTTPHWHTHVPLRQTGSVAPTAHAQQLVTDQRWSVAVILVVLGGGAVAASSASGRRRSR